jgi:hypothetical protein
MAGEVERTVLSVKAILESLTPTELSLEYARALGEMPSDGLASAQQIETIIEKLLRNLESGGKARST